METFYRLKDKVVKLLSPSPKRRRTLDPSTSTPSSKEHAYLSHSEPRDTKAQAAMINRLHQNYPLTLGPTNPRKRTRVEYEDEEEEVVISPGDSISQKSSQVGDDEASDGGTGTALTSLAASGSDDFIEEEIESGLVDGSDDSGSQVASEDSESLDEAEEEEGKSTLVEEDGDSVEEGEEETELVEGSEVEEEQAISDEDREIIDAEQIYSDEEEDEEVDIDEREAAEAERKVQEYLARQAELALRREDVEKVKAAGGWDPESLFLYERLALRSFEPLIHNYWRIDFPTLPEDLFTPDEELTFVNSNFRSSGSGVKALQSLISLGVRVRDKLEAGGSPEKMVARAIKGYLKWSERDGGFEKMMYIPVHTIVCARSSQSAGSITAAITSQMKFLGDRHRENLSIPGGQINEVGELQMYRRPLPVLYGLIVAQAKVILATCSSAEDATIRHIGHVDFKNQEMDVWNGFAIAFMFIAARNYIMSIKDELEVDATPDADEDA
ncbi:hypothetical protein LZ554_003334 [Drepanopeziza brunnea f. sp. 'monogermtubi']|nr:hypothetical protein LZ554_003334 [Drepanopeziza brunnea f. sp. 'monogermtubi']